MKPLLIHGGKLLGIDQSHEIWQKEIKIWVLTTEEGKQKKRTLNDDEVEANADLLLLILRRMKLQLSEI